MECRVEYDHVRDPGEDFHKCTDALEVRRVVEGGQMDDFFYSLDDFGGDKH